MGSLVSPIIAKMYIEHFKERTLRIVENPTRLWRRYIDDTLLVQWTEHKENFVRHINSIDQSIKFTVEDTWSDSSMPFLGILKTLEPDRTLSIRVYRKPTNTNEYLNWDSHHHIVTKCSIINTLNHGSKQLVPHQNYSEMKRNIYREVLPNASTPLGFG